MPHLAFNNYEWDNWNLFHKVVFDGPNKLILVTEGTTTLDIKTDVYSAWKEWLLLLGVLDLHDDIPGYLSAIRAIGGEPTVGIASVGSTFFLTNGWRMKSYSGNYTLQVNGNIFVEGGGDVFTPADVVQGTPNNITINLTTSNLVDLVNAGFGSLQQTLLDELHKLHGLSEGTDLIVTPTTRTAGPDIAQTITTIGGDTDPVTITRDP